MKRRRKDHYILSLRIVRLEDGRFLGRSQRLPGLNVQGDSVEEVLKLAPRVARDLLAAMRSKGVALPRGLTKATTTPLRVELLVAV